MSEQKQSQWPQTGLHPRIPSAIYHKLEAASCSILKVLAAYSPAHAKHQMDNGIESEAMKFGSAFHMFNLEPELYATTYTTMPHFDRRTKQGKADALAWEAENADKLPIYEDELVLLQEMRKAIQGNKLACELLNAPGLTEASFLWVDPDSEQLVKARTDRYVTWGGEKWVLDLKTTTDASERGFTRAIGTYRYDLQVAIYGEALSAVCGVLPRFAFIAVEKEPPYGVGIYEVRRADLADAWEEYKRLVKQFAECRKANHWPSYEETIVTLEMPKWAKGPSND